MRAVIGVLLIVVGIAAGVYAGIWWAFIGGIVDVITEIRADELSAMGVAIGVAKVFFSGLIGWVSVAVFAGPGYAMITMD